MSKTFLQYDSRWAKKKYPSWGTGNYRNCGCGPSACASIIYNINKSITPKIVGDYISGIKGATKGGATEHNAIVKALKHFGLDASMLNTTNLYGKKNTSAEQNFIKAMKNGSWGIILFGKSKFTAGGHYMACTDIRVKNGTTYLYLRDSGLRKNTGWFTLKEIQGKVKIFYTSTKKSESKPKPDPNKATDGEKIIAFAKTQKGKYATRTHSGKDKKPYHNKFTLYFKNRGGINAKGEMPNKYGYIPGYCTLFVAYCYEKCGHKAEYPFSLDTKKEGYWWHAPSVMKWCKKNGKMTKNPKPGDLCFKGKDSPTHTCIFIKSDGKYIYTIDGNVGGGVKQKKRKKSVFCGFAHIL